MKSPCIFCSSRMISPLLLALLILPLTLAGCSEDQVPKSDTRPADRPAPVADAAPKLAPTPAERAAAPETTVPTLTSAPSAIAGEDKSAAPPPRIKYKSGEDPEFAKSCGWPVNCTAPLPGAILPQKRIVAYYGNPNSRRMGALGEYEKDEMLRRLMGEAELWGQADPALPVQPALHLIAVVAQDKPGKAGKYRMIMPDEVVNRVYGWAKEANALLFIDIQTGHDDIRALLPRFEWILKNPDVHLGIDPEFNLIKSGRIPGTKIGSYDAADINYVTGYLAELVQKYNLPPKVITVHRFTRNGVTNSGNIQLRPEVQIVMHMDGWGAPWLKRDSYKDYVVAEPVQYTGFKLFYHNDTKKGDPLMTPEDVLRLHPKPLYIQYQ